MRQYCSRVGIVLLLGIFTVTGCHRAATPALDDTASVDTGTADGRGDSASDAPFRSDDSESEDAIATDRGTNSVSADTDTPNGSDINNGSDNSDDTATGTETGTETGRDSDPMPAVDQVAPGTFPVLTDGWDVSLLQSLNCLLWTYDAASGELEINVLNEVATATTLPWHMTSETSGSVTTFVIYKDDPYCSENSGHVYNWRISSSALGVQLADNDEFDVAIRNCKSMDFEIWRSDVMSLADSARGSRCSYISYGVHEFSLDGCGTRDGQCRTPETEEDNPECLAGQTLCDDGLECVANRCLPQCESDTDCGETAVYTCDGDVCILR